MSDAPIRTAVFGGTFNPLHNGHLSIARSVIESGLADELWLMVTPQNPWKKNKALLSDNLRLEMAREAVAGIEGITASDFEFSLPKPSYSASTMRSLQQEFPGRQFMLVMGADNWTKFDCWKDSQWLLDNFEIIVYPRPGYEIGTVESTRIHILDCPLMDISSTEIVRRIREGLPIEEYVPASVARTICEQNLYQAD